MTTHNQHTAASSASLVAGIDRRRLHLGNWAIQRKRIYLDLRFWIGIRDAIMGRVKDSGSRKSLVELYENLAEKVSNGSHVCPVSDIVFREMMKQGNADTRIKSARIADKLSEGLCLIPHVDRSDIEIEHMILAATNSGLPRIEQVVWTKPLYLMGQWQLGFESLPAEESRDINQKFSEYAWDVSFEHMVASIDDPSVFIEDLTALVDDIRVGNSIWNHSVASFADMLRDELCGVVDCHISTALEVIMRIAEIAGIACPSEDDEGGEVARTRDEIRRLLCGAIQTECGGRLLRTMRITATCHAVSRWDKNRKFKPNDYHDFKHAAAALGYCDVFLTERSLAELLGQRHHSLGKLFPCRVISSPTEAAEWARNG